MHDGSEEPRSRLTGGRPGSSVKRSRGADGRRLSARGRGRATNVAVRVCAYLPVVALAAVLGGCAAGVATPAGLPGAAAPPAAVERFLRLATESDYGAMGWVFGTADGPVIERDSPAAVERRMYALATLLGHERAVIGPGSPVPGRSGEAIGFDVELRRGSGSPRPVGFVVVRGPGGRWFVEQLDVVALTGG